MNNMEELLWAYIDGLCTTDEQKTLSALIANDDVFRAKYEEVLRLNEEFKAMEIEEPPMAFTCNVMEAIRAEASQKPLKSLINQRLVNAIAAFFVITIMALLVFTFTNINWNAVGGSIGPSPGLKLPELSSIITKPVKEGFLFFDLVLGLFLFDNYLRKRAFKNKYDNSVV